MGLVSFLDCENSLVLIVDSIELWAWSLIMADGGGSLIGRLKQFDAYPKTLEDFRIKTYSGATS